MSRKRPSPVALVQSYFTEGMGAESTDLLAKVTTPTPVSPAVNDSTPESSLAPLPSPTIVQDSGQISDGIISDGQTIQRSDRRTVAPSHGPAVSPLRGPTAPQSSGPAVGASDSATVLRPDTRSVPQSDRHTVSRSDCRSVEDAYSATVEQQDHRTVEHQTPETVRQQTEQTVSYQTVPLDVLTLTYNQAAVLDYLINATGITSYRSISEATKIGIPSARDAVSRLIRRGFMAEPVTIRSATFQGFSYVLNESMTMHFISIGGLEQSNYRTVQYQTGQTVTTVNSQTLRQSHGNTGHSSSLKDMELTTTKSYQAVIPGDGRTVTPSHPQAQSRIDIGQSDDKRSDNGQNGEFILTGPVGIYWEGVGLQESQAKRWCEQFEIDAAQMKQQLEWARFDLVMNDKISEVRKDPISWFFGCLRQTGGCYSRPTNYKSPAEMRAEEMEKAALELAEARNRQQAAERELSFQKILSDPQSTEYQRLFSMVNEFAKEMGGKTLETAMREAYEREQQKA